MRYFMLLFFLTNSYATSIEFIGPCDQKPLLESNIKFAYENIGELTLGILEKFNAQYSGTEQSLTQAFDTPVGLNALEVINDEEMRSYGWCFKIDGVIPKDFPSDIVLNEKIKMISWYYGYAYYKKGRWLNWCQEAYKIKPSFLCD